MAGRYRDGTEREPCYGGDVDDATLAALEHDNLIRADMLAAGQVPGAVVRRSDGLAVFATGLPLRLFNQIVIDDERPLATGAIDVAVTELRTRGDRFALNLRIGLDDEHVATAQRLGLQPLSEAPWFPGMALHPLSVDESTHGQAPREIDIHPVIDAGGVADHRAAAASGFDKPVDWIEAVITVDLAGDPDTTVYCGYVDGEPVVAGMGIRSGRVIGVYNIATVATARGRGYGVAMTRRIIDDGAALGCDTATLQASDMGRPIYERLGFRTVVEYAGYVDPAATT